MAGTANLKPLNIAVAGLGTVGAATVVLLQKNGELIRQRTGREIRIVGVSARDRTKDRGVDLSSCPWIDDPAALVHRLDIDVIVELMGGASGPAAQLVAEALNRGKHVVTANKALLAVHGDELIPLAEQKGVQLKYEAAVAGGVPVITSTLFGTSANRVTDICALLNGTCNFILTTMVKTGRTFDDVLAEAQSLGYAEADPSTDIDGHDTAHKLALLTSLAMGARISLSDIEISGIRHITPAHLEFAESLGGTIKLVGAANMKTPQASVAARLLPQSHPLAAVSGSESAIWMTGDHVGPVFMKGAGAGGPPTASAVVADIIQLALNIETRPMLQPYETLSRPVWKSPPPPAFVFSTQKSAIAPFAGDQDARLQTSGGFFYCQTPLDTGKLKDIQKQGLNWIYDAPAAASQ